MAKCQVCGKDFVRLGSEVCCSTPCGWEREMKLEEARRKKYSHEEKICPWCRTVFNPMYQGQRFCCADCSDDYRDAFRDTQIIYKNKVIQAIKYARINPYEDINDILRRHGL